MINFQTLNLALILMLTMPFAALFSQQSNTDRSTWLVDTDRDPIYKRVFVDTDNFGPSYLDTLEAAYPGVLVDSVKFSILNDLAYYWHTRNLKKSLELTR